MKKSLSFSQRKKNGFGLIQVLLAMGLLSIVMMANMALTASVSKSKASQQVNFERDSLGNYIKSLISHDATCSAGISKTLTIIDEANLSKELPVAFRWPDLEVYDGVELSRYKVAVQRIYVKSVKKLGQSDLTKENFYLGELMLQERAMIKMVGGDQFKERSLGPLNIAVLPTGISKCGQLALDIPKVSDLKNITVNDTKKILEEAGIALPTGVPYEVEKVTASCDLTCVVDNFYARNNLSAESKADFYNHPTWKQVAQNYSTIVSEIAKVNGEDPKSAPLAGNSAVDNEILNNPLVTERTLDGVSRAIAETGVQAVQDFLTTQGADATATAASLISANGGLNSGSYGYQDLAYIYSAAQSAGISAAQAEEFFNNGGTIEQAMAAAQQYNGGK